MTLRFISFVTSCCLVGILAYYIKKDGESVVRIKGLKDDSTLNARIKDQLCRMNSDSTIHAKCFRTE